MDRGELPDVIIQELGVVFKAALTAAAPAPRTADQDGVERLLQALSRQVLGRVVEQVIAARVAAADPTPPVCPQCGGPTRCAGRARPRQLQGLVGDFTLHRPYFVCAACHQGHAPLDADLGVDGGALAPGLGRVVCRLGLEGSFGAATDQLAETLGIAVPEEAVRRLTEGVGAVAEAAQQAVITHALVSRRPAALATPMAPPVAPRPVPVAEQSAAPDRAWIPEGRHDAPPAAPALPPPRPAQRRPIPGGATSAPRHAQPDLLTNPRGTRMGS